jgi:hypothetical protein
MGNECLTGNMKGDGRRGRRWKIRKKMKGKE